jgi:hypothetical protein
VAKAEEGLNHQTSWCHYYYLKGSVRVKLREEYQKLETVEVED